MSTSIEEITPDDLRRMSDREGLILQGCGGDLQEWVDGINDTLTEAGILLNGSIFKNVSAFRHDVQIIVYTHLKICASCISIYVSYFAPIICVSCHIRHMAVRRGVGNFLVILIPLIGYAGFIVSRNCYS